MRCPAAVSAQALPAGAGASKPGRTPERSWRAPCMTCARNYHQLPRVAPVGDHAVSQLTRTASQSAHLHTPEPAPEPDPEPGAHDSCRLERNRPVNVHIRSLTSMVMRQRRLLDSHAPQDGRPIAPPPRDVSLRNSSAFCWTNSSLVAICKQPAIEMRSYSVAVPVGWGGGGQPGWCWG